MKKIKSKHILIGLLAVISISILMLSVQSSFNLDSAKQEKNASYYQVDHKYSYSLNLFRW